jgi:hypothetical protein
MLQNSGFGGAKIEKRGHPLKGGSRKKTPLPEKK